MSVSEEGMLATSEWINQKLVVCDTIACPGFPEWYDRQNSTPIFRMGTISGDPRLNYSYIQGAPDAARIAYEGFSTGGASGSSYLYKSSTILDLIDIQRKN